MHPVAVGPEVYAVDTGFVRPGLASAHVVVRAGEVLIVDPGVAPGIPGLLAALSQLRVDLGAVRYVCTTHVHLDHAGGTGVLLPHLPNATVLAHPRAVRHLVDPARLIEGAAAVYGAARMAALYGDILPVPQARVQAVADGLELELAGATLAFLDTPGHARHHYCLHDRAGDAIFPGDTFGIAYPELTTPAGPFLIPTTTPVQFDPEALHTSVDRLMALRPRCLYLMHYGALANPQSLAGGLHRAIDAHVAAVRSMGAQGEAALAAHLLEGWLDTLQQRGCALPRAQQAALLAMDAELNAQGLLVWHQGSAA